MTFTVSFPPPKRKRSGDNNSDTEEDEGAGSRDQEEGMLPHERTDATATAAGSHVLAVTAAVTPPSRKALRRQAAKRRRIEEEERQKEEEHRRHEEKLQQEIKEEERRQQAPAGGGFPHYRKYCTVVGSADKSSNSNGSDSVSENDEAQKLFCRTCYCYVCDKPVYTCVDWEDCHCHAKIGDTVLDWVEGCKKNQRDRLQVLNKRAHKTRNTESKESALLRAATRVYHEEVESPGDPKILLNHHQKQCLAFMKETEANHAIKSGWICSGMYAA